jgi:hypothetical protein
MEVHAHTHTERKKWTHYFWEFLMLFLAVFCGFLAENQREHLVEHQREKKLIKEMAEDLMKDTAYLQLCIQQFIPNHLKLMDSAIAFLEQPGHDKDKETYQAYLTATEWNYNYMPTERTLSQFRSYGYRLIRNSRVGDGLSELEIVYKIYMGINDNVHALQNEIDESAYVFADQTIASNLFITTYPFPNDVHIDLADIPASARINKADKDLNEVINKLKRYNYYIATSLKGDYLRILELQRSIIKLLKEEYHME